MCIIIIIIMYIKSLLQLFDADIWCRHVFDSLLKQLIQVLCDMINFGELSL